MSLTSTTSSIAAGEPGMGAGVAAALTGAMAASLVERAARATGADWDGAGGCVAQAVALRRRLERLAVLDAAAFADAVDALHHRGELPDGARDHSLGAAVARAGEPPAEIAAAAADVAELAAIAAREVDPEQRPDACAAVSLAHAAARATAQLVAVNLTLRPDDDRLAGATGNVARAAAAEQTLD